MGNSGKEAVSISGRPRVVVVGAGFGGLAAVRALDRTPVNVLLVDRNNYHTFLALLYQVAAAELGSEEIVYPVRTTLRSRSHAEFCLADVKRVDLERRVLETAEMEIPYDYLILAPGSVANFFGVPGAAEHCFPLKTLKEAIALRNHILTCVERAAHEPDAKRRQRLLTFTVVGGGSTGVEFAGALAELIGGPLPKDYPRVDFRQARIVLLEALDSVLPGLPPRLCSYAQARLGKLGVEVQLQARVNRVTAEAVHLEDGTSIATETVVWTAGVQGNALGCRSGLPTACDGRVEVLPTLEVPDRPEVYVIGDLAYLQEEGHPLPMVAPVAIQQGAVAARNIARQITGLAPLPFRYANPGMMVILGRNSAVAQIGRRLFTGFPAWILWLAVHIARLIGFRNRLVVLLDWAWDYLLHERAIRLILPLGPPDILANRGPRQPRHP